MSFFEAGATFVSSQALNPKVFHDSMQTFQSVQSQFLCRDLKVLQLAGSKKGSGIVTEKKMKT